MMGEDLMFFVSMLYIYDPDMAFYERMERNRNLHPPTMRQLQDILLQHHRYAAIFQQAHEILARFPEDSPVTIRLLADPHRDQHRYNLPSISEIAAVIPGNGTAGVDGRDIILHRRRGGLTKISDSHRSYTCLHYVLFFPYGEDQWHPDMSMRQPNKRNPSRLTRIRYVAFRIFPRPNEYSLLLRGGALFQQYLVDMFASTDQDRLNYLRHHQQELRAALYSGLHDALTVDGDGMDLHNVGQ